MDRQQLKFLLPAAALVIALVLFARWWYVRNRTQPGEISSNAEGIEIEDVTGKRTDDSQGVSGGEKVELSSENNDYSGEFRYNKQDGQVDFTVMSDLPRLQEDEGWYQVWFRSEKGLTKAMKLQEGKAGYLGDGIIKSDIGQVEILVSKEKTDDDQMEEVVMRGMLDLSEEE